MLFYRQEDEKAKSAPSKDKENEEANASLDDTRHHGNPLFQSSQAEAAWKTVQKKSQEPKARYNGEGLVFLKKSFVGFAGTLSPLNHDLVYTLCYTHALHWLSGWHETIEMECIQWEKIDIKLSLSVHEGQTYSVIL